MPQVDLSLLQKPLLHVFGYDISILGLIAFAVLVASGLTIARVLQSDAVRRFFSRFKIDQNLIAITTTILSLAAVVFFVMSAINAAGIPLSWNAPVPGIKISLVQIFLLVALLIGVFWLSSKTKHFLYNVFLRKADSIARCSTPSRKSSATLS